MQRANLKKGIIMKTKLPAVKALLFAAFGLICGFSQAVRGAEGAPAKEALRANARIVGIEAYPASIQLGSAYHYSQALLTAVLDTGDRVDVTRLARIDAPASLVKVSREGLVRPVADGKGQIRVTLEGKSITVPVVVAGQKTAYPVSFIRDVMPMMSKLGCNAGTCHGAQKGKNGFKLSLRGYDPLFDHLALTDDLQGRRFNRSAPDNSLMLLKPSGRAPHGGGVLMQPGDPSYELLRAWIGGGVKLDLSVPRVAAIDIFPKNPTVPLPGMKQQMGVIARYTDGSVRDVSAEAFVETSNSDVATVDKNGLVTTARRGEATMLARYEGAYAATTMIVMGDRSGFQWKDVPEHNYIDTLVDAKLKKVKLLPSALCTDSEFIRRIYLDLTGLPPEPADVRAFLADSRPTRTKREAVVDKLVGSADYVEHWTNKWADLLQVNRKFLGDQGAVAFRKWIHDAVAANMPYDKFANTILTASGSNVDNPPASYYKILRRPDAIMENTTQLFLAIRFNCNKCHDHPFEKWTQDQYYQMAAYFAQVGLKEDARFKNQKIGGTAVEGAVPLVEVVADQPSGEIRHERTGVLTPPTFPYEVKGIAPAKTTRRELLARWITSRDNPYFAKSYANRVWSYLVGVGIIEPVDDIRAGNPPSNPELLDRLTAEFIKSNFNVQELVKTICKSRVYQQSIVTSAWNKDDELNYSHALARRLPAEVLFDAIYRATGAKSNLPGMPRGARAAQAVDSQVPAPGGFLDLFGRPPRESACECERTSGLMLGPILNLVNGPVIADAIKDPQNRLASLIAAQKDDKKVVEEIFLALLCRPPTAKELAVGVDALQGNRNEYAVLVAEHKKLQDTLAAYEKQIPAKQTAWEKGLKSSASWIVLDPTTFKSQGGATLTKQADQSILASGKNPFPEKYTVTANTTLTGITAIRLEVLADGKLPAMGPGRAPNGNFVLNEFGVTAAPLPVPVKTAPAPAQGSPTKSAKTPAPAAKANPQVTPAKTPAPPAKPNPQAAPVKPAKTPAPPLPPPPMPKPVKVNLHNASADFAQVSYPPSGAIDNNPATGWAVSPVFGKNHVAIFETKKPAGFPGGTTLTFTLDQVFAGKEHNIGRFRLSVTTAKPPVGFNNLPDHINQILAVAPEKRTPQQQGTLSGYYRSLDPELIRLQKAVASHYLPNDARTIGAQDLAWALINSPAFLFNH
jgi:hypothetical protein